MIGCGFENALLWAYEPWVEPLYIRSHHRHRCQLSGYGGVSPRSSEVSDGAGLVDYDDGPVGGDSVDADAVDADVLKQADLAAVAAIATVAFVGDGRIRVAIAAGVGGQVV